MKESKNTNENFKHLLKKVDAVIKGKESHYFDVEEILQACDYYLEHNKLKGALLLIEIAQSQHPNSAELMIQEAQILSMQDNFTKALALLDQAQNLDPNNEDILLIKAEVFSNKGQHEDAIVLYKEYLLNGQDEHADIIYSDIAWEYESLNDFENALKYLQLALKISPLDDSLLFEIAYFFEILEKPEESIQYYNDYLDENPYSYNAWYNLGNVYNDLELYEKAVDAFDFATVVKEDFPSAYFNKGNALFKLKKFEKAIETYEETFNFEENQAITYCYIGECYEKLNNLNKAEESFNTALGIDDKCVEALIGLTVVKDLEERTLEGLHFIEKAIKLYPENHECWYIIAEVYDKLDRNEEALDAYVKAYDIKGDNTQLTLDYTNFMTENTAIEDAIELIKDSSDIKVRYRLVAYILMIGRQAEAKLILTDCLIQDYELHSELIEYYPEIKDLVDFMEIISTFKQK
jgi:tetratricopeptide (TPR) repeat protein